MTTQAAVPIPIAIDSTRKFTVDEYYLMAKVGILHEDDRVELIDGRIVEMPPIGSHHSSSVKDVKQTFRDYDGERVTVGIQDPVRLDDGSEPQPDISILRLRADNYRNAHPGPADILLLIEVSDSSIIYDRNVKVSLYARAGIIETWLINLVADCIEVYREPGAQGYQQSLILHRGDTITPQALPDITLNVDDILPPAGGEVQATSQK